MRNKITVGLFFGKKDHILLWYFYHLVASADFNFITKAVLKHHIKEDHFKIHIYTDLSPLLLEDLDSEIENESVQRNITFTKNDGFLYDWVESISKPLRGSKIKQILTDELLYCLDILKNGDKKETEENKDIVPNEQYPYQVYFIPPQGYMGNQFQFIPQNQQYPYPQSMPYMQQEMQREQAATSEDTTSKPNIEVDEDTKKVLSKLSGSALSKFGRISFNE